MQVKLVVASGSRKGEQVDVVGPKFIIGRDRDCHLRCNSDVVSRHHCALIVEDEYVSVVDFSSKNGTYVDGVRVERERELQPGSLLAVGPLRFFIDLTAPPSSSVGRTSGEQTKKAPAEKTSKMRHPEEIVDDWIDRADPDLLEESGEGIPSFEQGSDPSRSESPHTPKKELGEPGNLAPAEGESGPKADTRSAASDALRKIGKMLTQKKK